jgi:hypothetical protein
MAVFWQIALFDLHGLWISTGRAPHGENNAGEELSHGLEASWQSAGRGERTP